MTRVYGYVNGEAVYSAEEFKYKARGFGAIETDEELLAYAEKVTHGWYYAGHKRTFTTFYLSDYCLSEPCNRLTKVEFERLKELQKIAIAEHEMVEKEKAWKKVQTVHYADNSTEEIWENKYGERKTIMTVGPGGDACH